MVHLCWLMGWHHRTMINTTRSLNKIMILLLCQKHRCKTFAPPNYYNPVQQYQISNIGTFFDQNPMHLVAWTVVFVKVSGYLF